MHHNSFHKRKIIPNKNNYDENDNFVGTPNFSQIGKTPKNNNINIHNKELKSLNFNENKETKLFKVCQNEKIEIINKKNKEENNIENKFVFKTEEEIIDYVYKKFEEERKKKSYFNRKLRFTGFILTKKYKGKNLYDIRIEDDLEQINQKLKDENVLINDKNVELNYVEYSNRLKSLEEENKKLKEEINNLKKSNNSENEFNQKLENEKQNINEGK